MLYHPDDPSRCLVELTDLTADPPPPLVAANREPLATVAAWSHEYLSRPHPELGREGPVCPFVPGARRRGLFYMTVHRGTRFDRGWLRRYILDLRDWFVELPPTTLPDSMYKTILNLFPDLEPADWSALIDSTQLELKPEFVPLGLMVGEFHPAPPEKRGLHNVDFRPLRCPVPLLAIRHMVPTDFLFLKDEKHLVEAYLARFGKEIPPPLRPKVAAAAEGFGLEMPAAG